jgi:hypothetical protein
LEASARVGRHLSFGLGEYFADIARDWRGWDGVRQWASCEYEFRLKAEADRAGHVTLRVQLDNGSPAKWQIEIVLLLEAGGLDRIATQARTFELSAIRAP